MKHPNSLLLYFEQGYLKDYFVTVANHLHQYFPGNIILASAIDLPDLSLKTYTFPKEELKYIPSKYIWSTVDLLSYVKEDAFKISTFHHAGYGESIFVPSAQVLKKADLLLCSIYQPTTKIKKNAFQDIVISCNRSPLYIAATGYPKLDHCWQLCQQQHIQNSIMVALTDFNDINYNVIEELRVCLCILLRDTNYEIILRPFPRDFDNEHMKSIISYFSNEERFKLSKGSYINSFASSKFMVFFGRPDATTAYTYAYSTEKPVLFIEPNINEQITQRDIGYSLQGSKFLTLGMKAIERDSAALRIIESRQASVDFVGSSLEQVKKIINFFCFGGNKKPKSLFEYSIGNKEFDLSTALDTLYKLVDHISHSAKQHGNSYVIHDYVNEYLNHLRDVKTPQKELDIVRFIVKAETHIQPSAFFSMLFSIIQKLNKQGTKLKAYEISTILTLTKRKFKEIQAPAELFQLKALRLLDLLDEKALSKSIVERMVDSKEPKTLLTAVSWCRKNNSELLNNYTLRYLIHSKFWNLKKLTAVTKNYVYSFFGDGESTQNLLTFIRVNALPLPKYIYTSSTCKQVVDNISILNITDFTPSEHILIVSPSAYKKIETRLLNLGIRKNKLIKIVN